MQIAFSIQMHIPFQDKNTTPTSLISFRFWMAEDINCEDWTTTRTYSGRIRVRHLGISALQEIKRVWSAPFQTSFVRRSVRFQESPNGLELDFTVTDQEVWATPPPPATSWEGTYTVTSPYEGGPILHAACDVTLKAPRRTDKRALLRTAQLILDTKLHYADKLYRGTVFLMNAKWSESLSANMVRCEATVRLTGSTMSALNIVDKNLGFPLEMGGYKPYNPPIGAETTTLSGIFLAALNDPCHVAMAGQVTTKSTAPIQYGKATTVFQSPAGSLPPGQTSLIDSSNLVSSYNLYRMASDLHVDRGKVMLPTSAVSGSLNITAVPVSVHRGIAYRIVRIEAERTNEWPEIPKPVSFSDGSIIHTLLDYKECPSAPVVSACGWKRHYHVLAVYTYGLSRIPDYSSGEIKAGLVPYSTAGSRDIVFFIPGSSFKSPVDRFLCSAGSEIKD
jgi:hypothetical protein